MKVRAVTPPAYETLPSPRDLAVGHVPVLPPFSVFGRDVPLLPCLMASGKWSAMRFGEICCSSYDFNSEIGTERSPTDDSRR